MLLKLNCTVDITPNTKAVIEPRLKTHPKIFLALKKINPMPKINGIMSIPPVTPTLLPKPNNRAFNAKLDENSDRIQQHIKAATHHDHTIKKCPIPPEFPPAPFILHTSMLLL